MVIQVIQEKRRLNTGQKIGKGIGGALSSLANLAVNQGMEKQENEAIKRETGANLQGIRDPQTRQALVADELRQGRRYREAAASQQINLNSPSSMRSQGNFQDQLQQPDQFNGGSQQSNQGSQFARQRSFQERLQQPGIYEQEREPEPVIRESQYEERPTKRTRSEREPTKRSQGGRTLEPNQATTGRSFQLLDPQQMEQEAIRLSQESMQTQNPLRKEDAMQLVLQNENAKATHNQNIEHERQQKQFNQRDYGSQAVKSIEKLMPPEDLTDEHRAYFQRLGEEAARKNENESDFQKKVAKEAFKFKDDLANIQKSFPSARIFNKIKGGFYGNTRKAEEEKADIKIKLKPLTDKGLFNTARKFLAKADFFPEESEALITDLSEGTKKNLSSLPNLSKESNFADYLPTQMIGKAISKISPVAGKGLTALTENIGEILSPKEFTPENLSLIENNMRDIFSSDPNTNLILLRKAYEDKGVDWRTFKNQMNKMVLNGEIKLNDDQMSQFNSNIDSPPEGYLDVLLRKSGLIGR